MRHDPSLRRTRAITLDEFGVDGAPRTFLRWTVAAGWNLLVAGATSAGKTTLLNALSQSIPHAERIVTIEETAELRLAQPHVVRLEARPPNAEGAGGVTVRALVRAALRMRPDRLVVGEVRGGEALDMLQALNTGHDGSHVAPSTPTVPPTPSPGWRPSCCSRIRGCRSPPCAPRSRRASTRWCSSPAVAHGDRRVEAIAEVDGRHRDGVRQLFVRRDDRLVPIARVTRAPRRHDAARALDMECARRPEVHHHPEVRSAVLTLVLVVVGPLTCAGLIAAGRRAAVADRARSLGPRSRWRVPERLRTWLVVALRDADVPWTPEEAVEYWCIAGAAVTLLAAALSPVLAGFGVLGMLAAGPAALVLARSRRERAYSWESLINDHNWK